jgi:hypothetical protein
MNEIYRDSVGKAALLSIPGATVTSVQFERNGTVVSATATSGASGWTAPIPYEITYMDGEFTAVWEYSVDGKDYIRRESFSVVTPIFTKDELVEHDSDFSALSDAQVVKLERQIRQVIEKYTGQTFGYREGTIDVYGNGTGVLNTGARVTSITYLVPYGYTNPEQISGYAYGTRIINDGYSIIKNTVGTDGYSIKADDTAVYDAVIGAHLAYRSEGFAKGARFTLSGRFGWESVPQEVKDAGLHLADFFSCNEAIWRERYVKSMRSADWRVDFMAQSYVGTGSLIADQLLSEYVVNNMVVL